MLMGIEPVERQLNDLQYSVSGCFSVKAGTVLMRRCLAEFARTSAAPAQILTRRKNSAPGWRSSSPQRRGSVSISGQPLSSLAGGVNRHKAILRIPADPIRKASVTIRQQPSVQFVMRFDTIVIDEIFTSVTLDPRGKMDGRGRGVFAFPKGRVLLDPKLVPAGGFGEVNS
jgi:hypothetical protein